MEDFSEKKPLQDGWEHVDDTTMCKDVVGTGYIMFASPQMNVGRPRYRCWIMNEGVEVYDAIFYLDFQTTSDKLHEKLIEIINLS